MSNPHTPSSRHKEKTVNHFHLMSLAFAMLAIVAFWKGNNMPVPVEVSRTINGLPALRWEASNPTDFVLYSEQEADGAYRYLCTVDERKCLPAKEVMGYVNAHGSAREVTKR